jgi:PST family polysaccharide transporter
LLRKRLDFKRQFAIDVISYPAAYGGVAVPLALAGYGVWSLAWATLIHAALTAAAQLVAVRHPMVPLVGRHELRNLFRFGFGAHVSGCLNYAALNGDNFVVGRLIGAAGLGLYSRAYSLMNMPFALVATVMSSVLFPALSQVQGDSPRIRRGYLLTTRLVAMIAAPAMVTVAIAAPHLVQTVYGGAWIGIVLPLQILCAAGYFRALYHLGGAVSQSAGRVYSELWRQGIYAVLVIGGTLAGARYGLAGVAAGVSLAILYMFMASGNLALQITGTTWRSYFLVQVDALKAAVVTGAAALALRLMLEASDASSPAIALSVAGAAAVPWSAGLLRTLGEPGFDPLRARLPRSASRLIAIVSGKREPDAVEPITAGTVRSVEELVT